MATVGESSRTTNRDLMAECVEMIEQLTVILRKVTAERDAYRHALQDRERVCGG